MLDINEEIEHHQKMITVLRRRRHDREIQAAQYGIDVPPHIANEIEILNQQLVKQERELSRLKQFLDESNPIPSQSLLRQTNRLKRYHYFAIAAVAGILSAFLTIIIIISMKSALGNINNLQNKTSNTEKSLYVQPITKTNNPNKSEVMVSSVTATRETLDFSGTWVGTVTINDDFNYSFFVIQNMNDIKGTSRSFRETDPRNYAVAELKGSIRGESIIIEETRIIAENPPQSSCLLRFILDYISDGPYSYLKGS